MIASIVVTRIRRVVPSPFRMNGTGGQRECSVS